MRFLGAIFAIFGFGTPAADGEPAPIPMTGSGTVLAMTGSGQGSLTGSGISGLSGSTGD